MKHGLRQRWARLPWWLPIILIGAVWVGYLYAFGTLTSWLCADNCPWSPRPR